MSAGGIRSLAWVAQGAVIAVAIVTMAGCGGNDGVASPTTGEITVALAPNPIRAATCPPSSCGPLVGELEAVGTLTVREAAGVAGTVETVSIVLRMANGRVLQAELDTAAVARVAGSSRVAGGGTLSIPVAMHFTPGVGVLPGVLTVAIAVSDDLGNRLSGIAEVNVN